MAITIPAEARESLQWILWIGSTLGITDFHVTMHLFQNNITIADDTTVSSFEEADYGGYAPQVMMNVRELADDVGGPDAYIWDGFTFQPTDDSNPNTIHGLWVDSDEINGETKMLWVLPFDEPFAFDDASNYLTIGPVFTLSEFCI